MACSTAEVSGGWVVGYGSPFGRVPGPDASLRFFPAPETGGRPSMLPVESGLHDSGYERKSKVADLAVVSGLGLAVTYSVQMLCIAVLR